jgi:hypothetical protein
LLILGGLSFAVGLVGRYLLRRPFLSGMALLVAALAIGLALGPAVYALAGCPVNPVAARPRPRHPDPPLVSPDDIEDVAPLKPGSEVPRLTSSWLNGSSPPDLLPRGRPVVLDIWSDW